MVVSFINEQDALGRRRLRRTDLLGEGIAHCDVCYEMSAPICFGGFSLTMVEELSTLTAVQHPDPGFEPTQT